MHELDEHEQSSLNARGRLVRWAEELEAKERMLEERQVELEGRERAYRKQYAELKQRVTVLDAADRAQAQASKVALETAAATVVQRAVRRKLAQKSAEGIVAGLRALRSLEKRYQAAMAEYNANGNQLLLDHELTKILEAADGISTSKSKELRALRKAFVRRVMRTAGDESVESDNSSDTGNDTGSEASLNRSDSDKGDSWVAIDGANAAD